METTFIVACKKYFGTLPGQTLLQFGQEIKKLTPEDKAELRPLLAEALGEVVTE